MGHKHALIVSAVSPVFQLQIEQGVKLGGGRVGGWRHAARNLQPMVHGVVAGST